MTDIVWSLRNDVPCNGDIGCSYELCNQAADEITRLRAEVAWHVEDKNAWQDTQAAHLREVTRLTAEVSELNSMFDARWSADMRAIECWRKVNPGNELVLPDHVDLSLWLMEERTRLTARVKELERVLSDGVFVLDDLTASRVDDEVLTSLIDEFRATLEGSA